MTGVTLAFYKGRADKLLWRIQDWAVRFATNSVYSHVELIGGEATLDQTYLCLTASGRDGGVRAKNIHLRPEAWDLCFVPCNQDRAVQFITDRIGLKYDYKAILLSQLINLGAEDPDKWFCSEIIAAALPLDNTTPPHAYHWYSPKRLAKAVNLPGS